MSPFDIVIIVLISAAVVAVAGACIYRKVRHKGSGCSCGCEGCPSCGACHGDCRNEKTAEK